MHKTLRVCDCGKMENTLYVWFMQVLNTLLAKAIEFYQKITNGMIFVPVLGGKINLRHDLVPVNLIRWKTIK